MSWPTTPFGKSRRRVQISAREPSLTDFFSLSFSACQRASGASSPRAADMRLGPPSNEMAHPPVCGLWDKAASGNNNNRDQWPMVPEASSRRLGFLISC
ncbi:hypothetical protein F4818DRAFT_439480 [Hypoxylon cercidicola]|nr:hypothetical protein F4818DRAFT_439480 [Hypoxylon cercidicola]